MKDNTVLQFYTIKYKIYYYKIKYMEFTFKNLDATSALLSVNIQEADYTALVEKQLKEGIFEEVALKDFEAPLINAYLIYRQNYDVSLFLENKF